MKDKCEITLLNDLSDASYFSYKGIEFYCDMGDVLLHCPAEAEKIQKHIHDTIKEIAAKLNNPCYGVNCKTGDVSVCE